MVGTSIFCAVVIGACWYMLQGSADREREYMLYFGSVCLLAWSGGYLLPGPSLWHKSPASLAAGVLLVWTAIGQLVIASGLPVLILVILLLCAIRIWPHYFKGTVSPFDRDGRRHS